ncbi:hypothetical protein [Streptomyces daliensis]|uniref:Uncharacterized protein n=1 Tax=Streptomyces daliensis TaxID=299421 RepID=A0A8T4IQP0_9ACTN|nr:hypothetical protein [Streptomyces daliensis]
MSPRLSSVAVRCVRCRQRPGTVEIYVMSRDAAAPRTVPVRICDDCAAQAAASCFRCRQAPGTQVVLDLYSGDERGASPQTRTRTVPVKVCDRCAVDIATEDEARAASTVAER